MINFEVKFLIQVIKIIMPSFPLTNNHYHRYYASSIVENDKLSNCQILLKFLKYFVLIVLCIVISLSWDFVIEYLGARNILHTPYIQQIITAIFISTSITILVHIGIYVKHDFHSFTAQWKLIICLYFATAIIVASIFIYLDIIPHIHYLFGQNSNQKICNYIRCIHAAPHWFIINIFVPSIVPLIIFLCYCLFRKCKDKYYNSNTNNELELTLLETHSSVTSSIHVSNVTENKTTLICVLFYITYFIIMFIYFLFTNINLNFLKLYFEYCFVMFLIWTSIFKLILKKIARIMDYVRNDRDAEYEGKFKLCIEYLVEWILSVLYWIWLRALVAIDLPSTKNYLILVAIHIIAEFIESNVKFTKLYFMLSASALRYIEMKKKDNELFAFVYYVFNDDSELIEWRNRLSMDALVRFYASVISGIVQCLVFISIGKAFFVKHFGINKYRDVLMYTAVSTSIEILHYLLTYLFLLTWYKFNMIEPFVSYVSAMNRMQVLTMYVIYCSFFFVFWSSV
eukprot:270782_1